LEQRDLSVKIHDDYFKRDEEDRVWLRAVAKHGWVIFTKDQRLRYRPLEIAALRSSRARVFVLVAGRLRGSEIAAAFVAALPRIYGILHKHSGPFVARITKDGGVTLS
jgi:hypothetical protein